MGLFAWMRRGSAKEEPPEEWWARADRLEHEMEQLKLSWEETYAKVRRALANIARRQKLDQEDAGETNAPTNGRMTPHEIGERLRAAKARYGGRN